MVPAGMVVPGAAPAMLPMNPGGQILHSGRGHVLIQSAVRTTLTKFMADCPLCICFWLPAKSTQKSALDALDMKNYTAFQSHSKKLADDVLSGYKWAYCCFGCPIITYVAFIVILFFTLIVPEI